MKILTATAALVFAASTAFAAGTHSDSHGEMMSIGMPGKASAVDRTVNVIMKETEDGAYIFEPKKMTFKAGETVRFNVVNKGELVHEFVMDEFSKNVKHKEMMQQMPDMGHADANAIRLEPGQKGQIIWTFAKPGKFEFACLLPGHYESGMHGPLTVKK